METLNKKQEQAYNLFLKNESFFISGPGGTGKSYLIEQFQKHNIRNFQQKKRIQPIAVTAMTGSASQLINGQTLHSWAGLYDGSFTEEEYIKKTRENDFLCKKWLQTECLVIDEVSMLTLELFDMLNKIAQSARQSVEPMGGLQTILVGDFFQLPPVDRSKKQPSFCFESKNWEKLIKKNIILDDIIRQESQDFQQMLNEIRWGICSDETKRVLKKIQKKTQKKDFNECEIRPTEIYSKNKQVDEVNQKFLKKLNQEIITYESIIEEEDYQEAIKNDKMYQGIAEQYINEEKSQEEIEEEIEEIREQMMGRLSLSEKNEQQKCKKKLYDQLYQNTTQLSNELKLCIKSQVMLTKNIDTRRGLVNGSRGVITGFKNFEINDKAYQIPVVKFLNKDEIEVGYHEIHQYDHIRKICMKKKQIPLKLAWAISQHKCQGVTLDTAVVDIGKQVFSCGQAYVALSRCKSLKKLYIRDFVPSSIRANAKVIDFYKKLEQCDQYIESEEETEQDSVSNPSIIADKKF